MGSKQMLTITEQWVTCQTGLKGHLQIRGGEFCPQISFVLRASATHPLLLLPCWVVTGLGEEEVTMKIIVAGLDLHYNSIIIKFQGRLCKLRNALSNDTSPL